MIVCPARLEPVFSPRPWGSRSLAPFFPEKSNLVEPIGEAWMSGGDCLFAGGPFAGKRLAAAWPEMPPEWTGRRFARETSHSSASFPAGAFPLLVKFIFTEEKLSVQVHPDDEYAALHEQAAGGRGKTEMWYSVHSRPGAEVLAGLKPEVTVEKFKKAISEGTAESCLENIPLVSGDAIFVPAGTVHTIGPGHILCEIQQHSDLTYRVYDYNRRDANGRTRELHTEKALNVIRFGRQHSAKVQPVKITRGDISETHLVACRYFAAEKWEFSKSVSTTSSFDHFDLIIFLEGSGTIRWGRDNASYQPAQVWLIPASLGDYHLVPDASAATSLLRTYVPGDLNELMRRLDQRGIAKDQVARLVRQ